MPFLFELPTTGSVNFGSFIASRSYPSLPAIVTSKRSVVKDVLKRYKRLVINDRASHLAAIDDAIVSYLPFLLALEPGVAIKTLEIDFSRPLQVEWRSTLSSRLPGRDAPRPKLAGTAFEIAFVLSTLARIRYLMSRPYLKSLQDGSVLSTEQRTAAIVAASKYLLESYSIYRFLLSLSLSATLSSGPADVQPSTTTALAALAMAEANLAFVAKDDPYATAVADDRNDSNTDWMYKAPSIPKVRATLYARTCIAAADHASQARAAFAGAKVDDTLVRYSDDVRKTARAKAMRMLAVNSEASGSTGEALAWLNAAKKELGLANNTDGGLKGLRKLKQSWQERREDRKIERDDEWGMDGGRLEETRVVQMLTSKLEKENNTINIQIVPPFEPLLQQMPSGRDPLTPAAWVPPDLEESDLVSLRSSTQPGSLYQADEDDSGAEELSNAFPNLTVGAFPRSDRHTVDSYY